MKTAIEDLGLKHLTVVHAGGETFRLGKAITAVAFGQLLQDVRPIR